VANNDHMSAEPVLKEPPLMESDREISDALVLLYKLPDEAIDSIHQAKKALGLAFQEAALHTGLVTERELAEAEELIRRQNRNDGRGIIEEALRRRANPRDLVLWEGQRLHPGKALTLAHDPYCDRSETIRNLRTELLMRSNGRRGAGVFALLSASSGEGRSLLAAELAIAFAQLGSRTLLVDADLRRPRQHLLFGADNSVGLTQSLVDGIAPRLYGIEGVPNMALLTSGMLPGNPLELLSGSRFERTLAEWRRTYQFIIIDTPPLERFSDALAVASLAGNVLVVSRTNSTSFSSFNEMRRKLETTNAWVVGAVMNSF
jgi:receptor protein-tyrosine kinase